MPSTGADHSRYSVVLEPSEPSANRLIHGTRTPSSESQKRPTQRRLFFAADRSRGWRRCLPDRNRDRAVIGRRSLEANTPTVSMVTLRLCRFPFESHDDPCVPVQTNRNDSDLSRAYKRVRLSVQTCPEGSFVRVTFASSRRHHCAARTDVGWLPRPAVGLLRNYNGSSVIRDRSFRISHEYNCSSNGICGNRNQVVLTKRPLSVRRTSATDIRTRTG